MASETMLAPPLKTRTVNLGSDFKSHLLIIFIYTSQHFPFCLPSLCVYNSWAKRRVFSLLDVADLCTGFWGFWFFFVFLLFFNTSFVPQWSVLINVIKLLQQHEATEVHPGVLSVLFCPLSFVHQALLCLQQRAVLGSRTGTLLHHCSAPGGLTHSR